MGYQVYEARGRDCGYGVPAECDHPQCDERIDRGLSYLCGAEPGDDQFGCGLYFCEAHLMFRTPRGLDHSISLCPRCYYYRPPFQPKPDLPDWMKWKLTDESWVQWRQENPAEVIQLRRDLVPA